MQAQAYKVRVVLFVTLLAVLITPVTPAAAYWRASGSGHGIASTGVLLPPADVEVPSSASTVNVPVGWTASTGSTVPDGYYVTRISGAGTAAACGSNAAELVTGTSCTDLVPIDASYTYTVTAVYRSWAATSANSGSVVVDTSYRGPDLGEAGSYSILSGAGGIASTGATTISGDVGVSPGAAVSGFPPGAVGGFIHAGDTDAAGAQAALAAAIAEAKALTPVDQFTGDLNGRTFSPGVHHTAAALALTGTLILDGGGNQNSVFIFQVDAALNTAASSIVSLVNGAKASNVYWQVAGAAGTGGLSSFSGTILAAGSITIGGGTVFIGRALSQTAVTLDGNAIRFTVVLSPTAAIDGGATNVSKNAIPTITGTTDAATGSSVIVTIAGQIPTQTLLSTVQAGGVWAVTAAIMPAGAYDVVARVMDAAGNFGRATQQLTTELNPAPVELGVAASYSVLGTGVAGTGVTTMTGDIGVSPDIAVTGFPPGTVGGVIHAGDPDAQAAQAALLAAITDATSRAPHTQFSGDLNGRTFHYGVHHSSAAVALTGTVTLDAEGDPDAVFIFQADAALNTAAASIVSLINGATASNVYWEVTGAAGLGGLSSFSGTILATGAITLGAGSSLDGRALSRGTVTLSGNTITTR